ncbi:MAG: M48 family metalloprotease [Cyanobacteria bacterium P01_A01_bin.84]
MPSQSESSLQAGLTALKQGDYQKAKTILEAFINKGSNDDSALIQAKIGLIVTYSRIGEIEIAISLSETLSQSNNQQIKTWANNSLVKLGRLQSKQDAVTDEVAKFSSVNNSETTLTDANIDRGKLGESSISNNSEYYQKNDTTPNINSSKPSKAKSSFIHWQQAGRAKTWQKVGDINLIPLWLLTFGTFIALFLMARSLLNLLMETINDLLVKLPFVEPLQVLYEDPFYFLVFLFALLLSLSPWLLDLLLNNFYHTQSFSIHNLNNYSPETVRLLQRYYKQRKWRFLKLYIISDTAPIIFTYGNLPRYSRIVVSRGLLEQLENDEIAAIYALQLAHISNRSSMLMSILLIVTIPIYGIYKQLSHWADNISNIIGRSVLGAIANIFYLVWRLFNTTGIWLSQIRLYYSDRLGTEITGNPNGAIRALLKMSMGISSDIVKQEQITWQLETLNLVIPVGYKQSITYGSIVPFQPWESILKWEYINPYRWWFVVTSTHPMLGDRIKRLCHLARHWHLPTELDINTRVTSQYHHKLFFIGIAPFLGIPFGFMVGILMWLVWQVGFALHFWNLKWIYDDWYFLLGCMLIGFSFGSLIRINYLFPQINNAKVQTNESFSDLIVNPNVLPIDSIPVQIPGKLMGRQGTSNYLAQDLILNTNMGLVKLHHISWLAQAVNPQDFIGRQVTISGWLRRSNTVWLDIQNLHTHTGKSISSPHPIWLIIITVATITLGAYILLTG